MSQTYAEAITTIPASTEQFTAVQEGADLSAYVVLTDDSGSWILTTAESAEALDLSALENADATDFGAAEYGEFWAQVAAAVDVIGDCNNPHGASLALRARLGLEPVED